MRIGKIFTICATLGFFVSLGIGPALAEDDEDSFDQKIMRSIMDGFGFKRDSEPGISYQERAPLVIPPTRELPPPENTDATIARNPAWPKDPDVERRKQQAAMEKNRNVSDEREREQNPLRPDQLTPGGRGKKRVVRTDNGYEAPASGFGNQLPPSQLGFNGNLFGAMFDKKKEESAKFTGEPPRALLTEPPAGYQTPSPDQPYGLGKAAAPKATDIYTTRGELTR
jgi:hypothetical protein